MGEKGIIPVIILVIILLIIVGGGGYYLGKNTQIGTPLFQKQSDNPLPSSFESRQTISFFGTITNVVNNTATIEGKDNGQVTVPLGTNITLITISKEGAQSLQTITDSSKIPQNQQVGIVLTRTDKQYVITAISLAGQQLPSESSASATPRTSPIASFPPMPQKK